MLVISKLWLLVEALNWRRGAFLFANSEIWGQQCAAAPGEQSAGDQKSVEWNLGTWNFMTTGVRDEKKSKLSILAAYLMDLNVSNISDDFSLENSVAR